jgi:hypothetical protein
MIRMGGAGVVVVTLGVVVGVVTGGVVVVGVVVVGVVVGVVVRLIVVVDTPVPPSQVTSCVYSICEAMVTVISPVTDRTPASPTTATFIIDTSGGATSDSRLNSFPQLPSITFSFQVPEKKMFCCGGSSTQL